MGVLKDCEQSGGIIGYALKWLLVGGPQTSKPGKPKKTFAFRLLWFITAVPALLLVISFLASSEDSLTSTDGILIGILVFDIILWVLRSMAIKKKKNQPQQEEEDDE